jgi:DNA-binding IclR family transcriptional regulator
MVKGAPAVARAITLLDFLAAYPQQEFTLTELARAIDVNAPSTLAIVEALLEGGYLVRHAAYKTYRLGPSLVALGQSALIQNQVVEVAREEMQRLAELTQSECSAGTRVSTDQIVIVACEGQPRSSSAGTRVGSRVSFAPPFGAVYVAWGPERERDKWVARAGSLSETQRRKLRRELVRVRERGYSVVLESNSRRRFGEVLRELRDDPDAIELRGEIDRLMSELSNRFTSVDTGPADWHDVSTVGAPVFDSHGHVALGLVLQGFARPLTTTELDSVAARLKASAHLITKLSNGREPT